MILYTIPLAPNPEKIHLYIAERLELGVEINVERYTVNTLKGRHKEPEHLARNPFGTLPVLELGDGTYILESLAIIDYFERLYPEGTLFPSEPKSYALARDIERIADVRVGAPLGEFVHAKKSPIGLPPDHERAAALIEKMQPPLDYFENLLGDGRPMLTGENVSVADCTLASFFQFARFIEEDLIGDRPQLRAWDGRYRERPAAQAVMKW